jgi:phage terminase small subunit
MENQEKKPESSENPQEIVVLSPKRERFCQEYIKSHNGTQAAKNAGYSENSANEQAARLIAIDSIKDRIAQLEKPIAERLGLDTEWVLRNSKELVDRCMQKVPVMAFDPVDREMKQVIDEETGEGVWEFDSNGANKALDRIAKHVGGFSEHVDHTTKGKEIKHNVYNILNEEQKAKIEEIHNSSDGL